ncbi:MAG: hypothetical protein KTR20_14150 [Cellvibrionaceae bacterium]|nr:hypothetical protein [Cellvibrionaceae bacterium]
MQAVDTTPAGKSLGGVLLDGLDNLITSAVNDRFNEPAQESDEGRGEFANPGTVSQPVTPSQLPGGQPLNRISRLTGLPPVAVTAGIGALAAVALFTFIKFVR